MPEISRFFGIVIGMFYADHPPPHFHARYGKQGAIIDIRSLCVLEGELPARVLGFVVEWGRLHQVELMDNWLEAERNAALRPIAPLE